MKEKSKYMENLFSALSKYNPREINPLENFITEAFVWFLKSSPGFSSFFLNKINDKLDNADILDIERAKWSTQSIWGEVRPDMICEIDKVVYVFEHKVGSPLQPKQLDNYRRYAKDNYDAYKLILITAMPYQWGQNPDLPICWADVYLYIQEWLNKAERHDDKLDFLFNDFLTFLKNKGLAPIAPLSRETIIGYYNATYVQKEDIKEKSKELFENLLKFGTGGIYEFSEEAGFHPIVNKHKGGMGIDIFSSGKNAFSEWCPGLFLGFLFDHEKYAKPESEGNGPDCCLMFDYDIRYLGNYPNHELYKQLVTELSQLFKNKVNGWEFYNHLEQDADKKWHPLYIRKPMIELFGNLNGVNHLHEQVSSRFIEEITYPLQILAKNTCFKELRTANRHMLKLSSDQLNQ